MKVLLLLLLPLSAFASEPFPYNKKLFCQSQYSGFSIYVEALVNSRDDYKIYLKDSSFYPMPIYRQDIKFKENGDIQSMETSATVELFHIENHGDEWSGEFWYDMVNYRLSCKERDFVN